VCGIAALAVLDTLIVAAFVRASNRAVPSVEVIRLVGDGTPTTVARDVPVEIALPPVHFEYHESVVHQATGDADEIGIQSSLPVDDDNHGADVEDDDE
jgi:hypothetical protein